MKKMSLLLGSLGGAMAGYLLSNKKLRQELTTAKDTQAAAKIIGKHLASDGQDVAREAKKFAHAHQLDKKVAEGKKYVMDQYKESKKGVEKMIAQGMKDTQKAVKSAKKKVGMKA